MIVETGEHANKIMLIKTVREITGLMLGPAKAAVEGGAIGDPSEHAAATALCERFNTQYAEFHPLDAARCPFTVVPV